jgi:hypothetical protein
VQSERREAMTLQDDCASYRKANAHHLYKYFFIHL